VLLVDNDAINIQEPIVAAAKPFEVTAIVGIRLLERQKERPSRRNERRDARGANHSIESLLRQQRCLTGAGIVDTEQRIPSRAVIMKVENL
jgi:hypothetical protein